MFITLLKHHCGPSSSRGTRTPLEAELVQLGHPLLRDPGVRVAGGQPPLALLLHSVRWVLTQVASFGSAGQPCGTRQCPCPGMALKATSLARFASHAASLAT